MEEVFTVATAGVACLNDDNGGGLLWAVGWAEDLWLEQQQQQGAS